MSDAPSFRLGINYWPARTAMGFWPAFDRGEVEADFGRMAACGFDSVRIFLTWEDFQPARSQVSAVMVDRLIATLDAALAMGLTVMPTLFTGHMSGVSFIPAWALGDDEGDERFRVVSGGVATTSRLASWYADTAIVQAQSSLARQLAGAIAGHDALYAWDLGNENSNCSIPPDRQLAREWLSRVTFAIRTADPRAKVTIGLHMEDLVEDRNLGPREAAEVCDFLTMHGYPGYASWADGPTDERILPFLARMTRFLGDGADVLFSEFGVPTRGVTSPPTSSGQPVLVDEEEAAAYVGRGLASLQACGSSGAMLWCYTDYAPALFERPPLDLAPHERSFGLWRADGSRKPAVAVVESFAARRATSRATPSFEDARWLDLDAASFSLAPTTELPRLYRRYCEASSHAEQSASTTAAETKTLLTVSAPE